MEHSHIVLRSNGKVLWAAVSPTRPFAPNRKIAGAEDVLDAVIDENHAFAGHVGVIIKESLKEMALITARALDPRDFRQVREASEPH